MMLHVSKGHLNVLKHWTFKTLVKMEFILDTLFYFLCVHIYEVILIHI